MSELKDTEMSKIAHDWKLVEFGDLLEIPLKNGVSKPSKVRGTGFPMVNMKEIFSTDVIDNMEMELAPLTDKEQENYFLAEHDLLFARQSLVLEGAGKCSIFISNSEKTCFESHLIRARLNKQKANPYFYYTFFSSKMGKRYMSTIAEQAVVAGIRGSDLKELKVPYPSLREQVQIANLFSNIDNKITLLRQQNQDLEELAQTLFKRWFVEFEFPNENGEPYKSSGGKMVASELGEIPDGWNLSNLGELAENKAKTYKFNGNDVVFINTGDVQEGKFLHKNYSNPTGLPGQAKKAIELNDILYSEIRPRNKRFAFVDFDSSEYVVSTKFMVIKTKGEIYPHILYLILKQQASVDKIDFIAESRSGTFPQVTFDSISDFELLKAPMSIQKKFMDVLLPIMQKQKNNEQEIQSLTHLRDILLPKLMSGELRVTKQERNN